jgi:hypothetical protein
MLQEDAGKSMAQYITGIEPGNVDPTTGSGLRVGVLGLVIGAVLDDTQPQTTSCYTPLISEYVGPD